MNASSEAVETAPSLLQAARARVRSAASLAGILLGCVLLAACDPGFHRVRRFEPRRSGVLAESELAEMEQIAVARGFSPVVDPQPTSSGERDGVILAQYASAIRRDPDWGSCRLTVLLEPSGVVALEAWAFPSSGEPDHLEELREDLAASLLEHGYAVAR
jgi:hypothetical protein